MNKLKIKEFKTQRQSYLFTLTIALFFLSLLSCVEEDIGEQIPAVSSDQSVSIIENKFIIIMNEGFSRLPKYQK